jgi:hypothetical protein
MRYPPFRRFRRIPTCINWIPTRFLNRRHSPTLPFNLFEVEFKRSSLTVPLGCHYTSHGQSQYVALWGEKQVLYQFEKARICTILRLVILAWKPRVTGIRTVESSATAAGVVGIHGAAETERSDNGYGLQFNEPSSCKFDNALYVSKVLEKSSRVWSPGDKATLYNPQKPHSSSSSSKINSQ